MNRFNQPMITTMMVLVVGTLVGDQVASGDEGCPVYPATAPGWIVPNESLPPCVPCGRVVDQPPVIVTVAPRPRPTFTPAGVLAFGKLFQQAAEKGVENAMVRGFNAVEAQAIAADCPPAKPQTTNDLKKPPKRGKKNAGRKRQRR